MEKKLEDFIDDWQIDLQKKSATHSSGLTFRQTNESYDGTNKIEISNLPKWIRLQLQSNKSMAQCKEYQAQLGQEFAQIYTQILNSQSNSMSQLKTERSAHQERINE